MVYNERYLKGDYQNEKEETFSIVGFYTDDTYRWALAHMDRDQISARTLKGTSVPFFGGERMKVMPITTIDMDAIKKYNTLIGGALADRMATITVDDKIIAIKYKAGGIVYFVYFSDDDWYLYGAGARGHGSLSRKYFHAKMKTGYCEPTILDIPCMNPHAKSCVDCPHWAPWGERSWECITFFGR